MTLYIEQTKIQRAIKSKTVKVEAFDVIDSTNEYLKRIDNSHYKNHICIAEYQSKGKARLQRGWYSSYAKNVLLSMTHSFKKNHSELGGLSVIVSLSILKTLLTLKLSSKFKIKWPNDVYFKDQKISGILIETMEKSSKECNAVIGIGLNVNMVESMKGIFTNWTSLKRITSKDFDRNKICILLIKNLIEVLNEFEITGLKPFLTRWKKHDYLLGKSITIKNDGNIMQGLYKGINEAGNLLLQTKEGKVIPVASGDASIGEIV